MSTNVGQTDAGSIARPEALAVTSGHVMRIVFDVPPLFDEIDAAFHVAGKPVIYAWGNVIYNPQRVDIPDPLKAHEAVHGLRQGQDIVGWWRRYIDDVEFRLGEEIPAHKAEYDVLIKRGADRNQRRRLLKFVAGRMANPIYGRMVTPARALAILKEAA